MNSILVALIAGFIAQTGLIWYLQIKLVKFIAKSMAILDQNIAQAATNLVEGAQAVAVDPPNPMQMMIMQLLQQRISGPPRDQTGKFIEQSISSKD